MGGKRTVQSAQHFGGNANDMSLIWEDVGEELGKLARDKRWNEMPGIITDEMLGAFAVEASPDEVGDALKARYEGLIDRVALYVPFVPGERDTFWRTVAKSVW